MDRCALFVDAGYVLADGAMAVHGTRRRESVSWDYPGLLQLLSGLAAERSRLPLLRCYWYDATVEGRRSADHETLADLPGVKLRVARMRPGRREGVESEIHRDLSTLARNKAVSEAVVVSAEEDLGEVISDVQDMGMRVTLLHIPVDGSPTVARALRQECDDVAEITEAHLRPYVELISGAEPPRPDERDSAALALRPGSNVNGNGNGHGPSAGRAAAYALQAPASGGGAGQQVPAMPPAAAAFAAPQQDVQDFSERGFPERALQERALQERAVPERGAAPDHGYVPDRYVPEGYVPDYGNFPGYGPASGDYAPAPPDPVSLRQDQAPGRQDPLADMELPGRDELYGVPVALAQPAEKMPVRREPARIRQDGDPSAYSPGAVREQFRQDPQGAPGPQGRELPADDGDGYEPVAAGTAQVRRLPTRGAPADGPVAGQSPLSQPTVVQPAAFQQGPGQQGPGQQGPGQQAAGQPQPAQSPAPAPVVPMAPGGMGYSGERTPAPGDGGSGQQGGLPAGGQPLSAPIAPATPANPVVPVAPAALAGTAVPAGTVDNSDPVGQLAPSGPAAYPAGQPGVSLADAVQSAHDEGQAFGDSVARDAPALWLEAVLARKPRMPSDLEARLLQGSALPIDFLLHDEVRHALRRGFWDALERSRR